MNVFWFDWIFYLKFFLVMFVDIGDNYLVVDWVKFCYIYDDIDLVEVWINFFMIFFKIDEGLIVISLIVWLFSIFIFVVNYFMICIKVVLEKFRFV